MLVLMGIMILGISIGYVLTYPQRFGMCALYTVEGCVSLYANTIGRPLLIGCTPLLGLLFFLFISPNRVFYRWILFSAAYVPVGLLLILISDPHGGIYSYNIDTEFMVWLVTGMFLIVSFGIILFYTITQKSR